MAKKDRLGNRKSREDRKRFRIPELVLWSDRDTYKVFSFSKVL